MPMKRFFVSVVLVFGLFFGGSSLAAGSPQQITLLHVNDTHSHLDAWGSKDANLDGTLGGLPRAATIIAGEKATNPGALFVHGGDFMDGDFFFNEYLGVDELELLQSIGLDALVLGNHEFAFGPGFLKTVLDDTWPGGAGHVPVLGTNLDLTGYPELAPWITATLIKDVNGVKVGLFGLTTPKGALARPKPVVIGGDLVTISAAAVDALHASGAQVVVCVSHLGMDVVRPLAQAVSGIDVIVNGHDHAVLDQPEQVARPGGGTTLIVSAGDHYRWVGRLRLSVDGNQVTLVDYALLSVDANTPALTAVQDAVDLLKAGIVGRYGDVYHQQLGWAAQDIVGMFDADKAKRDTPLGNFFTDAYRAWTGTDIAIEALALLGDTLPQGPIVGADVFRAMSYGLPSGLRVEPYHLVTFRATGSELKRVLETLIEGGKNTFPQVAGMRVRYDSSLEPGHWIFSVQVGDADLELDRLYSVTVTEGVFSVLTASLGLVVQDKVTLPVQAFDAARTFVTSQGEVGPTASNRLRDFAANGRR
jgi:5'-nucleotidase/UDP-sugar diphosphatase